MYGRPLWPPGLPTGAAGCAGGHKGRPYNALATAWGATMQVYELELRIAALPEDGDYRFLATRPDLPGLLVAGETIGAVLAQAPLVAAALLASLKAAGDPLPDSLRPVSHVPFTTRVVVSA